jgi:hypothetical protein
MGSRQSCWLDLRRSGAVDSACELAGAGTAMVARLFRQEGERKKRRAEMERQQPCASRQAS